MATDNANPTVLEMATANTNPVVSDVDKSSLTPSSTFDGIEWPDYVVIAIYFLSVLAVGIYVSISLSNETKYSNSLYYKCITLIIYFNTIPYYSPHGKANATPLVATSLHLVICIGFL